MSLKWYKNAVLDETQEAYGRTWRVDRIETDGTIVFRCGKETAVVPRTDKQDVLLNPCKQVDVSIGDPAFTLALPSGCIQSLTHLRWDYALSLVQEEQAMLWVERHWEEGASLTTDFGRRGSGTPGYTVIERGEH